MSNVSSKKVQRLRGQVDLAQDAEIPALEQVGKEIESHLIKLAKSMKSSFWVTHKKKLQLAGIEYKDLAFEETTLWKDFVAFMTDKSQNKFIRNKLSLVDYLGIYQKRYFEKKKVVEVI